MKAIFYLLFFISFATSAQIKVVIKDSITGKTIPYVGIYTNENQTALTSDKKGIFKIGKLKPETILTFFTASYKTKIIVFKNLNKIILLQPKAQNLAVQTQLLQTSENYLINDDLSFKTHNRYFASNLNTNLIAHYIPYSDDIKNTPYLCKIQLGLDSFNIKSIFKLRFFEPDENNKPGNELTTLDIVIKSKKSIQEINGIYRKVLKENECIDLSKYKIKFPKKGLFLAVEIMNIKSNIDALQSSKGSELKTVFPMFILKDSTIGLNYEFKDGTWVKRESMTDIALRLVLTN